MKIFLIQLLRYRVKRFMRTLLPVRKNGFQRRVSGPDKRARGASSMFRSMLLFRYSAKKGNTAIALYCFYQFSVNEACIGLI